MNDRTLSFLGICRRARKLVIGAQACIDSVNGGKSRLILYASDFSENSLKPVCTAAAERGVRAVRLDRTKQELSLALGKLGGVFSVEDEGFAAKLLEMCAAE